MFKVFRFCERALFRFNSVQLQPESQLSGWFRLVCTLPSRFYVHVFHPWPACLSLALQEKGMNPNPKFESRRTYRLIRLTWPTPRLPKEISWSFPQKPSMFDTGDLEEGIGNINLSAPKPGFELSEELKTASDSVKKVFTLAMASNKEVKEVKEQEILSNFHAYPGDKLGLDARVAVLTLRIRNLKEHMRKYSNDKRNRQTLNDLVARRNKFLNQLRKLNYRRFEWLLQELKIMYTPGVLGESPKQRTRKSELRRMTNEYCEKIRKAKLDAYHATLKEEQKTFLREKAEILQWIESEEKALGLHPT